MNDISKLASIATLSDFNMLTKVNKISIVSDIRYLWYHLVHIVTPNNKYLLPLLIQYYWYIKYYNKQN